MIKLRDIPFNITPSGLKGFLEDVRDFIFKFIDASATWETSSIADGDIESKTITVQKARMTDFVFASFSKDLEGLKLSADVTALGTVTAKLFNGTGSAVNIGTGTLYVRVFRR